MIKISKPYSINQKQTKIQLVVHFQSPSFYSPFPTPHDSPLQ
jgi:hypothetical protein